eukprot:2870297-Pyramimonas_sp.AAC.1
MPRLGEVRRGCSVSVVDDRPAQSVGDMGLLSRRRRRSRFWGCCLRLGGGGVWPRSGHAGGQ